MLKHAADMCKHVQAGTYTPACQSKQDHYALKGYSNL